MFSRRNKESEIKCYSSGFADIEGLSELSGKVQRPMKTSWLLQYLLDLLDKIPDIKNFLQ